MSDNAKRNAAAAALTLVRDGMTLGIGTGSTANHFVRLLGARVKAGLKVVGVPTSEATRLLAQDVGVPMIGLDHAAKLDLAIDGADEIDPALNLIKGGGGAHLREKIVAAAADRFVVIADESKEVDTLGAFPLPVEVISFGFTHAAKRIYEALRATGCGGAEVVQRMHEGAPFVTDSGNIILDAHAKVIPDPTALADKLRRIPGVVEHGLFLGMSRLALIGTERGVERREV